MCNLDVILACSYEILLSFAYFSLPLILVLLADTGVLRPLGSKENTVCVHPRTPRRSSLPYDTATLSSLLDPFTVPTGNMRQRAIQHSTPFPLAQHSICHQVTLLCSSADKAGSEGVAKDARFRRLDPLSSNYTRPLEGTLPHCVNQQYCVNVRRGSVPADVSSELRLRNGGTNKSRTRKKVLRRRSSGGPEMFTVSGPEPLGDGMVWQQWHCEFLPRWKAESVLARRRGSLPIEVLATAHSGELVLLSQFILLC
jgi:hypothetical protein